MTTDRSDPSLAFTLPFQLTKKIHREVPELLLPEKEGNSANGKIVVITGGGTGIGAAAAHVWTRAGATGIVIAGRRKDKLDQVVRSCESLNNGSTKVLAVRTDLKLEADVNNLFKEVEKTFKRPADVVIANAGWASDVKPMAEEEVSTWWSVYEINLLGLHNTVTAWIRSQEDPKNPVGTVININSGLAGVAHSGMSAYGSSKLAAHRYMEFVGTEYANVRPFTLLPGIVVSDMDMDPQFVPYAKDAAELTGAWCLYLASPRAEYLRNSLASVNWDLEEMEARKADIEGGLLKIKWVPVLPCVGGTGL